jgi:hypothetical protein
VAHDDLPLLETVCRAELMIAVKAGGPPGDV